MKLKNIEIAIATIILLLAVYSLLGSVNGYLAGRYSDSAYGRELFKAKGLPFNFFINYFFPILIKYIAIYASFIWISCSLPDKFITQQKWQKAILSIIAGIIVMWLLLVLSDCLNRPYDDYILQESLFREFGVAAGMSGLMLLYEIFKQLAIWLLKRDEAKTSWKNNPLITNVIWFVLIWGVALFAIVLLQPYWGVRLFIVLIAPCAFITYLLCLYFLIPRYYYQPEKGAFWLLLTVTTLGINIPFNGFYSGRAAYSKLDFLILFLFIWFLQIAILLPLSLYLYKIKKERSAELTSLKAELGTSNAGLQFLRSQINPHFLFNALNTLYGTALMENAEKTGEGIQKLGDMMRFMLHENNQEKIALSREISYLHNYIDLQNLRIASSPNISIDMQIEDIVGYYEIAPMLLIPFIENAYKHGISLKEKSWINVNLFRKDDTLHLDVHNSIHPQKENDPERYHSGTGLDNVKQRLQLLYPERHELVIRQNTKEFFIHLSLTLSTQKSS